MYLKTNRKYKSQVQTITSTDLLDLPEAGLVSAIKLDFRATAAANINTAARRKIADRLTKIEVTDGGTKTMFSLTGQEAKALSLYALGKTQPEYNGVLAAQILRSSIMIPFGEYIGDPKRALDLSAYDQVSLELTNDASATQYTSGTQTVDVSLLTLEDLAAKPVEYYKHYQWKANKPAAAGQYVNHALPTTEKIRRYFIQVDPDLAATDAMTNDPAIDTSNVKFSFLAGKEIVVNARPFDVFAENAAKYGLVDTDGLFVDSATVYVDTMLAYVQAATFSPTSATTSTVITAEDVMSILQTRMQLMTNIGTGTTTPAQSMVRARGMGYYHTMCLFDAMSPDSALFLDPSKTGSGKGPVELEWYCATADHTVRSCLTVPMKNGEA
jgi:hypothetical protein